MDSYRFQKGICLRLFVGEADMWHGKPLYQHIIEQASQHGVRGATVVRGIEGYGPEHYLSTERMVDIADNLPLLIEMVDSAERIEALLPTLDQLMQRGMITMTPVSIITG